MQKYELFNMNNSETISGTFTHFIKIVSGLEALDKNIPSVELVNMSC